MIQTFPSIAHCAMYLINLHSDWSNKQIADEVVKITGSRTGPGNISWYKGKIKAGTLSMSKYLNDLGIDLPPTPEPKAELENQEVVVPHELIVTEEDVLTATGIQRLAFDFIRDRSEKSFNKLYARLRPGMIFHSTGILKDSAAAEDVVSIAFTKIWLKIEQYNKYWNFSTWAYRIVQNEAMQYLRKNKMTIGMDGVGNINYSDMVQKEEYVGENSYCETDIYFDEKEDLHQLVYEKVLNDINGLSKFYKEVMIDRELNGLKYKQIAEKYGININSVKTRIKRARMQIIDNNKEYNKIVISKNKKKYIDDNPKADDDMILTSESDDDLMDFLK